MAKIQKTRTDGTSKTDHVPNLVRSIKFNYRFLVKLNRIALTKLSFLVRVSSYYTYQENYHFLSKFDRVI